MKKFDIVILGGGVAGATAAYTIASMARKERKEVSVALFSNEETVYSRSALPSLIANEVHSLDEITVYPVNELERLNVKFYKCHEISTVGLKEQTVLTKNLENRKNLRVGFEKLIIATGSIPKIPPVKGVNVKGVYTVKWFKDVKELSKRIKVGMKALVVGAGFIGMETAYALLKRGVKVTVAEILPKILSGVLEPVLSDYIQKKAERMGIDIITEAKVEEIGGRMRVEYAKINGKKMDFDLVILATGVKPNTKIFVETDIKLSDYGAVKTDRKMQTNIENVYSVGDCAEKLDFITGKPVYRPLGSLAARTAEIAGINAYGTETDFEGSIRHQYDYIFNVHVSSMGLSSIEASLLGINTEIFQVKLPAERASFNWELLRRPFETKMCIVVEKGSNRIVGWQSVGTLKLTSLYDMHINDLIRKKGNVADIQDMGLEIL